MKKELPPTIKAAIFDLDGTLVDSLSLWEQIDQAFFHEHGMEVPKDYSSRIAHMSFLEMAEYTARAYSLSETPQEIADRWTEMSKEAYAHTIPAKPYAREYLSLLQKKGLHLALATTNKASLYVPCLRNNGLEEFFELAYNVNDYGTSKKEPKIYRMIAEKFGCTPSQTAVFEDIEMAVSTAKKAGFYTVGVYDPADEKDRAVIEKTADLYIRSYQELLNDA